jgi:hypothetical protein
MNVGAMLGFRINPEWEVGMGARWLRGKFSSDDLAIDASQVSYAFQVGGSFF